MVAITGTSDQPCWLAEACKNIFLLLPSVIPDILTTQLESHVHGEKLTTRNFKHEDSLLCAHSYSYACKVL